MRQDALPSELRCVAVFERRGRGMRYVYARWRCNRKKRKDCDYCSYCALSRGIQRPRGKVEMTESDLHICTVCKQPVLPGQARNALTDNHWDCNPPTTRADVDKAFASVERSADRLKRALDRVERGPAPPIPSRRRYR